MTTQFERLLNKAEQDVAANRAKDAKMALRKVLKKNPKSDRGLYLLGLIAVRAGKMKEADSWYRKALTQNPTMPEALMDLGNLRVIEGRYDDAIKLFRNALVSLPQSADVMSCLAGVLLSKRAHDEAEALAREAIRLSPNLLTAHNNLGLILMRKNLWSEAEAVFKHALTLDPNNLQIIQNLTHGAGRANTLEACKAHLYHGLKLVPNDSQLNLIWAKFLRQQKKYDEAISVIEKHADNADSLNLKQQFYFVLGHLYDQKKSYPLALEHYKKANELVKKVFPDWRVHRDKFLNMVQDLDTYLTKYHDTDWSQNGPGEEALKGRPRLAFEVGFPRSGTTLLGKIMDAHPQCQTMDETDALKGMTDYLADLPGGYPNSLAQVTAKQIVEMREIYFQVASEHVDLQACDLLVDKLPTNQVHMGIIHRVFPQAKIILALRHPLDCILSCFRQDFQVNNNTANFLSIDDACKLYRVVFDLWNRYVELLPMDSGMFRYEDLVENRETHLTQLMEFLELPWHDNLLEHTAKSKMVTVTPNYHQISQPIYKNAIARWKNYNAEFEPHKDSLAPYLKRFGYSAD